MGLLLLLLLGLPTPAPAALREFRFVHQRKPWTEAQSYCREKFTDLATVESEDDWSAVREIIAKSGASAAWIGLYADVKSWRWSLDNTSLYQRDLGSWFGFTEDNYNGDEQCVGVFNGQLHDYSCWFALRSVCYDERSNSYIVDSVTRSWRSARSHCRQSYTDLASIRHRQELDAVMDVTRPDAVSYWIGLSREGWKWSDRSQSSFRRWASSEPQGGHEACGAAHVDEWHDYGCDDTLTFICSVTVGASKVLKVTLKADGSVNLNDPLVQEAVLKQMEKDLRGQGVTQELRLSWRKQPHGGVFNRTEL